MKYSLRLFSHLTELSSKHLEYFHSILPLSSIQTSDLDSFNTDWLNEHKGSSTLVLKPTSTTQIQQILQYCNTHKLGIVPQSGNTSLVAGSVPVHSEIILSMRNLNQIISIDETQGIIWTESGVVLENLNRYCEDKGWVVPLDLASKGSCMIGGNISTNAGGVRLIKYGSLHGSVLGLEVILPSGEVLSDLKALRKDNTGFNLKQIFIGSEGSLGVITKAAILLAPKPKSSHTAFLSCSSFENVLSVLKICKTRLGETLSAFEFIDSVILSVILKNIPNVRNPFKSLPKFSVLVEVSGTTDAHDEAKMESLLQEIFELQLVEDGVKAQDSAQANQFWKIREGCAVATRKESKGLFKFDFSLKTSEMYKFVETVREKVGSKGKVSGHGHVGDGNLHLTIMCGDERELNDVVYPFVYEEVQRLNGSVSAEHGIGLSKKGKISYSKNETMIKYMKSVKGLFDPNGIMNPYKIF